MYEILQYLYETKTRITPDTHKKIRHRTPEAIEALKEDLREQRWTEIDQNNDPNKTYEEFLSIFTTLYNKHCPIRTKRKNKNMMISRG